MIVRVPAPWQLCIHHYPNLILKHTTTTTCIVIGLFDLKFEVGPGHWPDSRDTCTQGGNQFILAWEFVTRSCMKPQKPCSNHEIHALFEHDFYLTKPI